MKSKLLPLAVLSAALFVIVGCQKEPEASVRSGNFKVEKLFTTKEGCTVSRFYDDRTVYFTDCRGETTYESSCGKNCTQTDTVGGQFK
ncbi:hypothetical protein D3C75_716600 [compost metagenome]